MLEMSKRSVALVGFVLGPFAGACSVQNMAVATQAEIMEAAFPVIEEQGDFQFVKDGAAANLLQLEGLLRMTPDDPHLLMTAARGYASYAFAFLEDEMEAAELRGDFDAAERTRSRARAMYLKAKDFGLRLLSQRADGLAEAMARDPERLARFLDEHFDHVDDVPALFWTGSAWGNAIKLALDDPEMIADVPFPVELVARGLELSEGYYHAAGHVFAGVVDASRGEAMGGNPARARAHFERALALTEHKALIVQVNYAQTYAVAQQDRALFDVLVEEVLSAESPLDPSLRLANIVAKRRAERLRATADSLILPPLPPEAQDAPEARDVSEAQGASELSGGAASLLPSPLSGAAAATPEGTPSDPAEHREDGEREGSKD